MAEQITPNNKINKKLTDLPLKLAFQASIDKYVEKKKRELSVFASLNQNHSNQKENNSSASSSNLIKQNTNFNFYQPLNSTTIDAEMLLSARIKLVDTNSSFKGSIVKRKLKGHKYSLSDWRTLYNERDGIVQKHQLKHNSPDKLVVTDRLFYPSKKQNGAYLKMNCSRHDLKQKKQRQQQTSSKNSDKFFVSDQNFFHMYHRSITPIMGDYSEKQRIKKYLNLNKQRIENGNGLRRMNEGILNNPLKNDVGFIPYKFQAIESQSKFYNPQESQIQDANNRQKNKSMLDQRIFKLKQHSMSNLMEGRKSYIQRFIKIPNQAKIFVEKEDFFEFSPKQSENLDSNNMSPSKEIRDKNHINLSELLKKPNERNSKCKGQLRLKLFKSRKNKIQCGISNTKKSQSENKFANFQFPIKIPQSKKTSFTTTIHSTTKWVK